MFCKNPNCQVHFVVKKCMDQVQLLLFTRLLKGLISELMGIQWMSLLQLVIFVLFEVVTFISFISFAPSSFVETDEKLNSWLIQLHYIFHWLILSSRREHEGFGSVKYLNGFDKSHS